MAKAEKPSKSPAPDAARRPAQPTQPTQAPQPDILPSAGSDASKQATFPIVGIGCSAGGLDALEKFLSHVPTGSGMAFIIVQHLDPKRVSTLAELLQRVTSMKVTEAGDRMAVAPNCVYLIPPNKDLSILHGSLHLLDPPAERGLRLPIDFFLRTLADDQKSSAVGVILSGMGSDGVLGLRAIKEKGGLTLAQEPSSAKADSMPRSAIAADLADIVATPEDIPAQILAFLRHTPLVTATRAPLEASSQSALAQIIVLLRDRTGNDFSLYKTSSLYRRIERRIALHQIDKIATYVRYLRENPHELDLLFKELLIGVTNFFRDSAVWEYLLSDAIPALLARHPAGKLLRAWVPACSSGEEAYSLAIVFKEALARLMPKGRYELLIYATDLDQDAIDKARKGLYPKNIASDVSADRLARYFVADEANGGYRIGKEIREMVIFAQHNIISDPPFTKLDILTCRNLLIYFGSPLQQKLLPVLHYALNRDGLLLLGSAESIGNFTNLFIPVEQKARLFRRVDHSMPLSDLEFSAKAVTEPITAEPASHFGYSENLGLLTDRLIQQKYAPAAVLVSAEGDILYISGRTGKYLEPAAGKVNINIYAMARTGLREALIGVITRAVRQPEHAIVLKGLKVGTNGGTQIVNVTIQAIEQPDALRGRVMIVFNDIASSPRLRKPRTAAADVEPDAVHLELQQTREALQATHEEMQTSVEELKSSNEELQSTNEELQSANEELTTSKEEMQSLNEELQTINAELQSKVDELTTVRNDMSNLFNSTEIATVFLDNGLKLRRFTPQATKLFKLIHGDVGRPLSDIATELDYPDLKSDSQEVLRKLASIEKQVRTYDGRWFKVRIMPYRTLDDKIDGTVITFIDIADIKLLEERLRQASEGRPDQEA